MWIDTKQKAEYFGKDGKQSELRMYINDEDKKFMLGINAGMLLFSHSDATDSNGDMIAMGLELEDLEYFIKKMKEDK